MTQPLTDAINALTRYANEVTGQSDPDLSSAIRTLCDGYGGGEKIKEIVEGSITEFIDDTITIIRPNAFAHCEGLKTLICHNVTSVGNGALNSSAAEWAVSPLVAVALPKLTALSGYTMQNWRKLGKLDLTACTTLGNNRGMENCWWLTVLVLRNPAVVTLGNTNVFNNTPLMGRQGRTADLYVPSALISAYESASNWSTILANGYTTIHAIEGSEYENYYVDGTPIE